MKKKRVTDETGREILLYPDGTKKDAANGQFLNGPTDPAVNPILADPRGMRLRRDDLAQQVAREANDDVLIELGKMDKNQAGGTEGYRQYCRAYWRQYYKTDNFRAMTEGFIKGAQAMGYLSKDGGDSGQGLVMAITSLFEKIINDNKRESIEGEAKDV